MSYTPSFRFASLLLVASLAACSSSKKKEDPAPTPGMSWSVDGAAATTTSLQSQKVGTTLTVSGTLIGSAQSTFVSLEIPNALGTYTFSPTSAASAAYSTEDRGNGRIVYYAGATGAGTVTGGGTIVVTSLTATAIVGTFTFTGINANTGAAKTLTNGAFNVGLM